MSALAPVAPVRRGIRLPPGAGSTSYVLAKSESFRVEALSFVVDTSGAAGPSDVTVQYLMPTGELIVGATVGFAQATLTAIQYSVAPHLNPCDGATWNGIGLTPDTFADIVLTPDCEIVVSAIDSTSGAVRTGATITTGIIWADDVGAPALDLAPVYLPVPIGGTTGAATVGPVVTGPGAGSASRPGAATGG